jgi:hypothetical protein
MREMAEYTQYYETAVYDRRTGVECRIISIPTRRTTQTEVRRALGLRVMTRVQSRSQLNAAVELVLQTETVLAPEQLPHLPFEWDRVGHARVDPWLKYVDALAFDPIVPVEQSPLTKQALGVLMGGGAVWVVAFEHRPLLLLITAASVIVLKAAWGVGDGLEEGLRERVADFARHVGRKKHSGDTP